jgi:uncharacterized protein with FMN-binding domain
MRRITIWLSSTAAVLVLLFSYHTSVAGAGANLPVIASGPLTPIGPTSGSAATTVPTPSSSGTNKPSTGTSSGAKTTAPATTAPAASAPKVVTGSSVDTRWGPVQVAITVSGNKITAVSVPVYPNGNQRDAEINSYALPQLVQETIAAQSANINVVSGASVTSDGYIGSLQSAIDAAHL